MHLFPLLLLVSKQKKLYKRIPYQANHILTHTTNHQQIHNSKSLLTLKPIMIVILYQQSQPLLNSNMSSKFSFSSTFNWQDSNLKALLHPILFSTEKHNDKDQPFCHYTHKNMGTKMAPFREQEFKLYLDDLTNIKYISIDNYTHGAEMTISISDSEHGEYTEVYKDEYICKGKTLKNSNKLVDIGALPCRSLKIRVKKGCNISSKNIALIGIESSQIEERLGQDYFKLLVANPMKILYLI